jgi:hypothetical protein
MDPLGRKTSEDVMQEREEAKERLSGHAPQEEGEEELSLEQVGIDDFRIDNAGRVWCAGQIIGGHDAIDEVDQVWVEHAANVFSPAQQQMLRDADRARDDSGRFASRDEAPPQPLMVEPCSDCGDAPDLRRAHILGGTQAGPGPHAGTTCVAHLCRCGAERLTSAEQLRDADAWDILERASEESDILLEIAGEIQRRRDLGIE